MRLFFGSLVLICMILFEEIEASGFPKPIKTRVKDEEAMGSSGVDHLYTSRANWAALPDHQRASLGQQALDLHKSLKPPRGNKKSRRQKETSTMSSLVKKLTPEAYARLMENIDLYRVHHGIGKSRASRDPADQLAQSFGQMSVFAPQGSVEPVGTLHQEGNLGEFGTGDYDASTPYWNTAPPFNPHLYGSSQILGPPGYPAIAHDPNSQAYGGAHLFPPTSFEQFGGSEGGYTHHSFAPNEWCSYENPGSDYEGSRPGYGGSGSGYGGSGSGYGDSGSYSGK